jgi:hypothetical protein
MEQLLACTIHLAESQKAFNRWALIAGERRIKGHKCCFTSSSLSFQTENGVFNAGGVWWIKAGSQGVPKI